MITALAIGILIGWCIAYYQYSPKARVERTWKEILELTKRIKKYKQEFGHSDAITHEWEMMILKKKQQIKLMLDSNFDPQEDYDFIKENLPY